MAFHLWLSITLAVLATGLAETIPMKSLASRSQSAVRRHLQHHYQGPIGLASSSSNNRHHTAGLLFVSLPTKHTETITRRQDGVRKSSSHSFLPSPLLVRSTMRPLSFTQRITRSASSGMMLQRMSSSSSSTSGDVGSNKGVNISIEYCSACRWMLRSTWIASELLTTFAKDSKLASVTMVPQGPPLSEGGMFRVLALSEGGNDNINGEVVLWDRKVEGRFPEAKEVKQLVRDCVDPEKDLGHSDNKEESSSSDSSTDASANTDCVECKEEQQKNQQKSEQTTSSKKQPPDEQPNTPPLPAIFEKQNHVSIEYSTGSSIECADNGLYRATYYANESLSMIHERNTWWKMSQQQEESDSMDHDESAPVAVNSVTLVPNRLEVGILRVKLNDSRILHEQSSDDATTMIGGAHLRDIVKEAIKNEHSSGSTKYGDNTAIELMDDDEAEEARKYFGVF